jgi:anti-sigma-K factor RskA
MRAHQEIGEELVQYALGELTSPQSGEIREHLDDCPTCRRELEEIHTGMAALAMSVTASAPPARSRTRLLKAVAAEPHSQAVVMRRPWWNLVPAFASVLLAIIGMLLWRENSSLRNRVEALRSEVQSQQDSAAKAQAVLQTLTASDAAHFTLVAANTKPQPQGRATYLRNRSSLVFVASNLAPVNPGKTYELWLLPESGSAPIPAGTFKPDARGNASVLLPSLPSEVAAKGFAVTIENDGGSDTPTMPIVMAGV